MKRTITALSILSASLILAGCGKTSTSENIAPKTESVKTTTSVTAAEGEVTTIAAAENTAEATTTAASANEQQVQTTANDQNGGEQSSAGGGTSSEQGGTFAGRLNQGYQENYQNMITKMVDEAVAGGRTLFMDYALMDVTGDSVPELIINSGAYTLSLSITVYDQNLNIIGDQMRGDNTGIYKTSSGGLALATIYQGNCYILDYSYDPTIGSLVVSDSKNMQYGSADEIVGIIQNEGLTSADVVSISVDGGAVKSYYNSQSFDYAYLGIIV
ncbi:MAG: hypothetical protein K6G33_14775 [Ruminococcus sp.]|uniref:hypothetical protein n=1 Tax=Ruminococcus sp. TaxID=41978 RepID=UPI0025EAC1E6|nr:hypothetical protein [Ruminococcus sp.]MCR5601988.1 hypothetical protein [Ruminococcus sp.]